MGGGAIFVFSAKIVFKSAKNVVFCIFFTPMGGLQPPLPPGYATGTDNVGETTSAVIITFASIPSDPTLLLQLSCLMWRKIFAGVVGSNT